MLTPNSTLTLSYTVNSSSTNRSLLATVGRVQARAPGCLVQQEASALEWEMGKQMACQWWPLTFQLQVSLSFTY